MTATDPTAVPPKRVFLKGGAITTKRNYLNSFVEIYHGDTLFARLKGREILVIETEDNIQVTVSNLG